MPFRVPFRTIGRYGDAMLTACALCGVLLPLGLAVSSDERSDRAHFDAHPGHVLHVSSKTDETSNVQGYPSAELVPDVPRSWIAGANSPLVPRGAPHCTCETSEVSTSEA